ESTERNRREGRSDSTDRAWAVPIVARVLQQRDFTASHSALVTAPTSSANRNPHSRPIQRLASALGILRCRSAPKQRPRAAAKDSLKTDGNPVICGASQCKYPAIACGSREAFS